MEHIVFNLEDFKTRSEFSLGYSQSAIDLARKYFGNDTTKTIPLIPMLDCKGWRFCLTDEVKDKTEQLLRENNQTNSLDFDDHRSTKFRSNPFLIQAIEKVGLKNASVEKDTLFFIGIPADYVDLVSIDSEYEYVNFDFTSGVRKILLDKDLSSEQKELRITELDFISIVFQQIKSYYEDKNKVEIRARVRERAREKADAEAEERARA